MVSVPCVTHCTTYKIIAAQVQKSVLHRIQSAVNDDRFVAVLLDESTDSGNVSQLSVHYRVVYCGKIVQMFGALIPLGISHTADAILKLLKDHLAGGRARRQI